MEKEYRNKKGKLQEHKFLVTDAIDFGVEEAVILYDLRFWLDLSESNPEQFGIIHEYKGKEYYWIESTHDDFAKKFPYMNKRKIGNVLRTLKKKGIIFAEYFDRPTEHIGCSDRIRYYTIPDLYLIK